MNAHAPLTARSECPALDSRDPYDAHLMGYDGPCDPSDGEGLIVFRELSAGGIPSVKFCGPQGEVEVIGVSELRQVAKVIAAALASSQRAA